MTKLKEKIEAERGKEYAAAQQKLIYSGKFHNNIEASKQAGRQAMVMVTMQIPNLIFFLRSYFGGFSYGRKLQSG